MKPSYRSGMGASSLWRWLALVALVGSAGLAPVAGAGPSEAGEIRAARVAGALHYGRRYEQGRYAHGEKTGMWTTWRAKDKLLWRGAFEAGQRVGEWTEYHHDGSLAARGVYRPCEFSTPPTSPGERGSGWCLSPYTNLYDWSGRHGPWDYWLPDGTRVGTVVFERGTIVDFRAPRGEGFACPKGAELVLSVGHGSLRAACKSGGDTDAAVRHGPSAYWTRRGVLLYYTRYREGQLHGRQHRWPPQGKWGRERQYWTNEYTNGRETGIRSHWNASGTLTAACSYDKNGEERWCAAWTSQQQLATFVWRDGDIVDQRRWHAPDQLAEHQRCRGDSLVGEWRRWDENGAPIWTSKLHGPCRPHTLLVQQMSESPPGWQIPIGFRAAIRPRGE